MKKRLSIAIVPLLLMASCSTINEDPNINTHKESFNFQNATNIVIVKDSSTGCEYVIVDENSTAAKMSPYYDERGFISGCGDTE